MEATSEFGERVKRGRRFWPDGIFPKRSTGFRAYLPATCRYQSGADGPSPGGKSSNFPRPAAKKPKTTTTMSQLFSPKPSRKRTTPPPPNTRPNPMRDRVLGRTSVPSQWAKSRNRGTTAAAKENSATITKIAPINCLVIAKHPRSRSYSRSGGVVNRLCNESPRPALPRRERRFAAVRTESFKILQEAF